MRIYLNCYELRSELMREVYEMGHHVESASMQNKDVKDNPDFLTKEIINYSYCLKSLDKTEYLFLNDPESRSWVDTEFKERVSILKINPGEAWKIRKEVWEQFLNDEKEFDYTYNERMRLQLPILIQELRKNPNTRQAILSIWQATDVHELGGKARVPCSIYYHFMIRHEKLHIIYNQRSCDIMTHFGNDIYLAWKLMDYVAEMTGNKVGYLYHNIASLHCYQKDWEKLKLCINDVKII